MWNLPGGRVESNESPWDAVIREVTEEVGLLVRVERLLGIYAVPARADLVLNFLCVPVGGAIRLSDEPTPSSGLPYRMSRQILFRVIVLESKMPSIAKRK